MKKGLKIKRTLCVNALRCLMLAMMLGFPDALVAQIDYTRADSLKVVKLLDKAEKQKSGTNMMVFFARQLCGLPYEAKTLENNSEEKLVVNLRQLDCTTYVESVTALALCVKNEKCSFADYCEYLRQVRYRKGVVGYPTRLHYFSIWIDDNVDMGFVKEINSPNPPFSAKQMIDVGYMTSHVSQYPMLVRHPEWVARIADLEKTVTGSIKRYIPKNAMKNTKLMRKTIHDGDIIAIVTTKKGLDISHVGIAVWHKDGLHMLNASQLKGKVVEDNTTFYNYLSKHQTSVGARFVRLCK